MARVTYCECNLRQVVTYGKCIMESVIMASVIMTSVIIANEIITKVFGKMKHYCKLYADYRLFNYIDRITNFKPE